MQFSQALLSGISGRNKSFGGEQLRLSQREMIAASAGMIDAGVNKFYLVGPGGIGKSRVAIYAGAKMAELGGKTLFITYLQQSCIDIADNEAQPLVPHLKIGKYYAKEKTFGDVTFITYFSFLRASKAGIIKPGDFSLLILDEAHMYLTDIAKEAFAKFLSPIIQMSMTATPKYYEGKEVANHYGPLALEIPIDLAKERGEISKYCNFQIQTGISTGIKNLSPEMEESPEVIAAINTTSRNKMIAEFIRDGRVTVNLPGGEKKFIDLLGEPILIIAKEINYAHALAQTINETIAAMPQHIFRIKLIMKGIDPDKCQIGAKAIHSSETDLHEGMDTTERQDLINDYHARKVLILVSTSLLQQSFNSPMTSVTLDAIPRQTYVGVGQAGMRATRIHPKKEMAIIVNIQDDYPSLSFADFVGHRGFENGIALEFLSIYGQKDAKLRAKIMDTDGLARRTYIPIEPGEGIRHFAPEQYKQLNELLAKISAGDTEAKDEFSKIVLPYLIKLEERNAEKYSQCGAENGNPLLDSDKIHAVIFGAFEKALEKAREKEFGWSSFSQYILHQIAYAVHRPPSSTENHCARYYTSGQQRQLSELLAKMSEENIEARYGFSEMTAPYLEKLKQQYIDEYSPLNEETAKPEALLDPDKINDVISDAFAEILEKATKTRLRWGYFNGLLVRKIDHNLSRSLSLTQKHAAILSDQSLMEDVFSAPLTPVEIISKEESFASLDDGFLLAGLDDKERYVVTERFFNERACEDIGLELDLTGTTIRNITSRAIGKIRERMDKGYCLTPLNLNDEAKLSLNLMNIFGTEKRAKLHLLQLLKGQDHQGLNGLISKLEKHTLDYYTLSSDASGAIVVKHEQEQHYFAKPTRENVFINGIPLQNQNSLVWDLQRTFGDKWAAQLKGIGNVQLNAALNELIANTKKYTIDYYELSSSAAGLVVEHQVKQEYFARPPRQRVFVNHIYPRGRNSLDWNLEYHVGDDWRQQVKRSGNKKLIAILGL